MKRLLLILVLLIAGCGYVEIDDKRIDVEIVESEEEREKGLMHRKDLCESCGMLFVFEESKRHPFWMKNTTIPLDIIFIQNNTVVDLYHAEPCKGECKTYVPVREANYVLETNINTFNKSIIGEKVRIN